MLTIHYFASLRDRLNKDSEKLEWENNLTDIASIKQLLSLRGEQWQGFSNDKTILTALNQQMCTDTTAIKDGDDIAFFPPVTGG